MTKQYDNFADLITFTRASTGTYLDSDGLLETATTNTPRIEFDINGNRKGILIEEARTNLVSQSETLNVGWSVSSASATVTADQVVAPDGNTTAYEVNLSINGFLYAIATVVASTTYTASWYIKAGTATSWVYGFFDETAGSFISRVQYNITDGEDAGNGWYRFSVSVTTPVGCTSLRVYPLRTSGGGVDPAGVTGTSFLWGAQLEEGSFPTSYIPTAGAAATRAADVASIPTSAFGYNAKIGAGGTVIADFQSDNWQYSTGFNRVWEFDGSVNNGLFHSAANPNQFRYRLNDSSGTAVLGAATIGAVTATASAGAKIAIAYARDDFAVYANGSQAETDNAGLFANEIVTQIAIGGGSFNTPSNGHIKSLSYFPRRLTNSQLQRLTS